MDFHIKPIGYMKSMFHYKNGTPRQASICESARGVLIVEKDVFNNPEHSLQGLEEFSHAWILFVFHKNNNVHTKAKVKPPRLNGQKVGVFSTRSPYRPNNIGLSLVKIDKVEGSSLHVSGLDILDGTPVVDIKPYIPEYDQPSHITKDKLNQACSSEVTPSMGTHSHTALPSSNSFESTAVANPSTNTVLETNIAKNGADSIDKISTASNEPHSNSQSNFDMQKCDMANSGTTDTGQQVAEGFYELSTALNKVKEKLESPRSQNIPNTKPQAESVEGSDISALLGSILDDAEDDLNSLVGGIISKAAFDLTWESESSPEKSVDLGRSSVDNKKESEHSQNLDHDSRKGSVSSSSKKKRKGTDKKSLLKESGLSDQFGNSRTIQTSSDSSNSKSLTSDTCNNNTFTKCVQNSNTEETSHEVKFNSSKAIAMSETREAMNTPKNDEDEAPVVAPWLDNPPVSKLAVKFTADSLKQLKSFHPSSPDPAFKLQMLSGPAEVQKSITDILREEPRSVYRRNHCQDSLYFFAVDTVHVTCWFNEDDHSAEVVRVKPVSCAPVLAKSKSQKQKDFKVEKEVV